MSKHHSCGSSGSCGSGDKESGCGCCGCSCGSSCKCKSSKGSCGCCETGSCSCSCHQGQSCDKGHEAGGFAHELLRLADEAWMEVLKERIKEEIRQSGNGHIEELAKLVTETNKNRWRNKMAKRHNCEQFGEKLKQIFH